MVNLYNKEVYINMKLKSYWNVDLDGRFTDNNSSTLCIILPGIAYYLERPYLNYSKQLVDKLNYDILEIEYGFQIARKELHLPDDFEILLKETSELINIYLKKEYKNIIIIGKSIGTVLQTFLNKQLENKNITNIYISPIDKTADFGIEENSLVITGTKDPLLSLDSRNKIKEIKNTKLIDIEGAGHSLDIHQDVFRGIDELKKVIEIERNFLINKGL